jgi:serine/threonine protein kinase
MLVNEATLDMVGALALHTKQKLKTESNILRRHRLIRQQRVSPPTQVMTNGMTLRHYNHSEPPPTQPMDISDDMPSPEDRNCVGDVLEISRQNLMVGKLLGRGCFNDVYETRLIGVPTKSGRSDENFALKYLSPRIMSDINLFRIGAVDLVRESNLLSCLDHNNIISLHAVTGGCVSKLFSSGEEGAYFLVLDHLDSTLDFKISQWHNTETDSRFREKPINLQKSTILRLNTALSIARALQYLHQLNVMYRDLKPENVGFNGKGVVKLFDFGLAKEIIPSLHPGETFKHTSYTGALRFMAPEVAKEENYNLSADSYSFAIMLWHLLALEIPYDKYRDRETFIEQVIYNGKRPKIKKQWSKSFQLALKNGFAEDLRVRPTMTEYVQLLECEYHNLLGEKRKTAASSSRRRLFSLKLHD